MIKGRIILKGTIQLLSPCLIGSGEAEHTDIDVLVDADEKPYIPATSLIGVLRHTIKSDDFDKFWGFAKGDDIKSSIVACDDLYMDENPKNSVEIRDGIKINNKTGIVEDKAKYDYEIIKTGSKFSLYMQASYSEDKDFVIKMFQTIKDCLEKSIINIGAKTNSGLGKIKLIDSKTYDFDFSKKEDVKKWLKQDYKDKQTITGLEPYEIKNNDFVIEAVFKLKTSIIIRSYSSDPKIPDAVSMKSGDNYVIPGTSIKGAARARAERILNTLNKDLKLLNNLFGYVDEETQKAQKGRISINESVLPNLISELQTRIKIDRFTAGTIESALFEVMPLFAGQQDQPINLLKISIKDFEPYEAGLMLMVLKDLWTGDLAIGGEKNIGRGVFEGIEAVIRFNGNTIKFSEPSQIKPSDLEKLNNFVDKLGGKA